MDEDRARELMNEATEKLDLYVRALVKEKKNRQAQAFCEEKYARIALMGLLKKIISEVIAEDKENEADTAASERGFAFVCERLSGKTEPAGPLSETEPGRQLDIHVGEGVVLRLRRDGSGDYEAAVLVPAKGSPSADDAADPDMPDGKEEAEPLRFAPDRLKAFCKAAEYISDNAGKFKQWSGIWGWKLWEKYKYIDYPKKVTRVTFWAVSF